MNTYKNKKLLILAGASVHCKLVESARSLGVYTIVTDYLPSSPAKKISNEQWMLDINDVSGIVKKCKEEHVDGVICGWIDPAQRPYQEICEALKLPCYGTKNQFYIMTDKREFKKMCLRNNINTIPEYTVEDINEGTIEYPVYVKPVDSRGSRGQFICYNRHQTLNAIPEAKRESSNNEVLIEKYFPNNEIFQVTYFYVNGDPYILRTSDGYNGTVNDHLDKLVLCSISPSSYTDEYLRTTNQKVINMLSNLGIKNGPVMMQGFYANGSFYFFDPGLRFPGVDFDLIYKSEYGDDVIQAMIIFALSGEMPQMNIKNDNIYLSGKKGAILFPTISAGIIKNIEGIKKVAEIPQVYSFHLRHAVGEKIEWTYTVDQRLAEIDLLADNLDELKKIIKTVQSLISVYDVDGNDMVYKPFEVERLNHCS